MLATPAGSLAVQVMFWTVPISHDSPPLGEGTATVGPALSIGTVASEPATTSRSLLEQSRRVTLVTDTVPEPDAALLARPTSNSVPLVAVWPHEAPRITPSTVYEPPPLSVTWNVVEDP